MARRHRWLLGPIWLGAVLTATFPSTGAAGEPADESKFPAAITRFEPRAQEPVFTSRGPGFWDVKIRERGWVMRDEAAPADRRWRLWFTGYDGTREGRKKLGHAYSADGLTWTRSSDGPIYDRHWCEDVCVVRHDGQYLMVAEGLDDQAQLLTSADGLAWERQGRLDVRLADGSPILPGPYGTPVLWRDGDEWCLFYERRDAGVWLAKSTDLKVWRNVRDEPVLAPGPDEFDRVMVAANQIFRYGDRYYMVYHGSGNVQPPRLWATGLATSTDLVHWEKHAGNPLRPTSENKSSGQIVHDGERFRLYTAHERVEVHSSVGK